MPRPSQSRSENILFQKPSSGHLSLRFVRTRVLRYKRLETSFCFTPVGAFMFHETMGILLYL